jgi:hypothetical protein
LFDETVVNVFDVFFLFSLVKMTIKSKKVRQAEITFGKVISAEADYFTFPLFRVMCTKKSRKSRPVFSLV